MSLPLTPCRPTPTGSVEERVCSICGETRYSDAPDFEEGRSAYHWLPASVAGRWACARCMALCVAVTHCDGCFDRYTRTASVPTQACLRCEPESFGPRFAALEMEKLMAHFVGLDARGCALTSIEVANMVGSRVMQIREVTS